MESHTPLVHLKRNVKKETQKCSTKIQRCFFFLTPLGVFALLANLCIFNPLALKICNVIENSK